MMHKKYELSTNDIILDNGIYIMECPFCGKIHASSDEKELMPEMNICYGTATHEDWKIYKKKRGLTNEDIANIVGSTADSVKSMTQPNKELPKWAISMLYEWKQ